LLALGALLASTHPTLRVARLGVLACFPLLLLATFGLGARLAGRRAGLLAAALLASYPQVVGYSRITWMDLPTAAITVVSLWALLGGGLERPRRAVLLGLCLGLGALCKYSYPVFVLGPLLGVLAASWSERRARGAPRRPLLVNLGLATATAVIVAAPWYLSVAGQVWENFVDNQGSGALPGRAFWSWQSFTFYLSSLPREQLGWPATLLLLGALPLARRESLLARRLLLLWLTVPFVFFTFVVLGVEWSRLTLPCLPALALLSALGLLRLPWRRLSDCLALGVGVASVAGGVLLTHAPAVGLAHAAPLWDRATVSGLVQPASFGPPLRLRSLLGGRVTAEGRVARIAVFPDDDAVASVLQTWAQDEGLPVLFSSPTAAETPPCAGVSRGDPDLACYQAVVRVVAPPGQPPAPPSQQPQLSAVESLWRRSLGEFEPGGEARLAGGHRLLVFHRVRPR